MVVLDLFYCIIFVNREFLFMPYILIPLFLIALIITAAGLFLSPRSSARSPQNEYLVTPKGRRMVDAPASQTRSRRLREGERADVLRRQVGEDSPSVKSAI